MTARVPARRVARARRARIASSASTVPSAPPGPAYEPAAAPPDLETAAAAPLGAVRIVARSALAGSAALVPALEPLAVRRARRGGSRVRRRLAALLVAAIVVGAAAAAFAGARVVLARFTDTAAPTSSTFTTGTWATATTWYLHNNPTPPAANTTARFNLPLNATTPTATTLWNYDTNCDWRAGRSIVRGAGLVTEGGSCRYATWRTPALAAARTLDGTATLRIWARKTGTGGTAPTLRAFLRVYHPATSAFVELGSTSVSVATDATAAWAPYAPTWTFSGVTVAAGDQVVLKLVATGGTLNVEVAYDTVALASALTLP